MFALFNVYSFLCLRRLLQSQKALDTEAEQQLAGRSLLLRLCVCVSRQASHTAYWTGGTPGAGGTGHAVATVRQSRALQSPVAKARAAASGGERQLTVDKDLFVFANFTKKK